ncbi:hypothetical protein DM806_12815 [Sphingobium lactosutens]|uniref:hypothetical protein n=1 Tax=Sphingobium lactosutens TaxID=522773 RepID=UPI0015B8324A|nr:hypothetical protein [Sphingobium lactosutens]NWK96526.1 hypothetical protein [Sphingobium lactosutens]
MPKPSIADRLEDASRALDMLIRDARLPPRGRHDDRYADFEERALAIAASIIAPFRRETPSAPPISIETEGGKGRVWF